MQYPPRSSGTDQDILWNSGKGESRADCIQHISIGVLSSNAKLEDRYIHEVRNCRNLSETPTTTDDAIELFAVIDGHGGHQAAQFVQLNFSKFLFQSLSDAMYEYSVFSVCGLQRATIEQCLRSTFAQLDEIFLSLMYSRFKRGVWRSASIGCCVLVSLAFGNRLFIANAGDCRACLALEKDDGTLRSVTLTNDHNASNVSERNLLQHYHPNERVTRSRDSIYYVKGRVQCTRSIGDGLLKEARFNTYPLPKNRRISQAYSPPYITSSPEITCLTVKPSHSFVILATDGLYDFLSNFSIISTIQEHIRVGGRYDDFAFILLDELLTQCAQRYQIPTEALRCLPQGTERRSLHDDTTLIVILFKATAREVEPTRPVDEVPLALSNL